MKYLGIDVGSTTVKISVADPDTGEMLYSRYERHFSRQIQTVENLLKELADIYHDEVFIPVLCGSGSKPLALQTGFYYIQEVVANASAVCSLYGNVQTVIEIGGQDAKVIFFYKDPNTGRLRVSDMRMNGNCAGGTGAFIDEIASLLNVSPAEFEKIASCGKSVYDISGRCGVFAKTDIQPLLIQGASKNDIALSVFMQSRSRLSEGWPRVWL